MGYLGYPYQVEYDALKYQTGLEGIYAHVLRPDGQVVGPFALTEGGQFFEGSYFFNYTSSADDPPGEYKIRIISPQENNHISTLSMSLYPFPSSGGGGSTSQASPGIFQVGKIDEVLVRGRVPYLPVLKGRILLNELETKLTEKQITATIGTGQYDGLVGTVNAETIKGELDGLP